MGDRYRDEISLSRRNHKGHKGAAPQETARTVCEERRALRSEYFKAKAKGSHKTASWTRLDA